MNRVHLKSTWSEQVHLEQGHERANKEQRPGKRVWRLGNTCVGIELKGLREHMCEDGSKGWVGRQVDQIKKI